MGLPARLISATPDDYLSPEEYLAWEQKQPTRHEYVDGQIYAMAGVSKSHARITKNITFQLERHLFESACEPYTTDVKLEVKTHQRRYYYPDVAVTCEAGDEDPEDAYLILRPILIFEVLSPSTKRTDKVEKFNAYQHIVGLLEYVIVAQDQMRVEIYRHQQAGELWQGEVFTEPEQEVTFQAVGLTVNLASIYRRVIFPLPSEGEQDQ
jgi:Uma2 family endonuclease